jgi:hypothetical protein
MRGTVRTAVVVGLLALTPVSVAADDFGFREYTFGSSACRTIRDPLNLYFGAGLGTLAAASAALETVVGLDVAPAGADQWFWDVGLCQRQDRQRADAAAAPRRTHSRLNQGRRVDPQFDRVTAAPIHVDVWTWCGDVAESFDAARDRAAQRIQSTPGWFAVYSWTGNTAAVRQCDGRYTASDGHYVLARD